MSDKGYNGWANYETWNVALWMGNDGSDDFWRERAEELVKDEGREEAVADLAQEIEGQHDDNMPEVSGTYADLLSASLREVNWYEIAQHYVDDVENESEEEAE